MMGSGIVCRFTGQFPSLGDSAGGLGSPGGRDGRRPRAAAEQWLGPGSSSLSSAEADVEAAARAAAAAAARRLGGARPSLRCAGPGWRWRQELEEEKGGVCAAGPHTQEGTWTAIGPRTTGRGW